MNLSTPPPDIDDPEQPETGPVRRTLLALAGIVIVASFLPWAWRWSPWADRTADGLLDDSTFATLAEPICRVALTELEALPNALDADSTAQRGEQVREANAILNAMVADIKPLVTGSERDVANLNAWLADWDTYLENRRDYAERISVDENAVFYVSAQGIERLDRRIPRFAFANSMPSCITPDDIA